MKKSINLGLVPFIQNCISSQVYRINPAMATNKGLKMNFEIVANFASFCKKV